MPRRKKSDQSPGRLPHGPAWEWGSLGQSSGFQAPQTEPGSISSVSSTKKDDVVKSMQEMFSNLEPEVIYIVLSGCDFKVENAMDSLLELSIAAEGTAPDHPAVSGFEHTAAALLHPCQFSEPKPNSDSSEPLLEFTSSATDDILSAEIDLLIDEELEKLNLLEEENNSSQCLSETSRSSTFECFPQQSLPELLQTSLGPGTQDLSAEVSAPAGSLAHQMPASSLPLNDLSTWDNSPGEGQQPVVDFTHMMPDTTDDKIKTSFDLVGRSSAFQVYKKHEPLPQQSEQPVDSHSDAGTRSNMESYYQEPFVGIPSAWNQGPPVFPLYNHGHQMPTFIVPIAQRPSNWLGNPRCISPWMSASPVGQGPLKHQAPKSWAVAAGSHVPVGNHRLNLQGKVLVLLRGAPGSGKSTLARVLLKHNPGGVILSTDDYFMYNGHYRYNLALLGEAHNWNQERAKNAFMRGDNPIIIDNTNMQGWEMKPYVIQALQHRYKVLFREPDTWWKNKPRELARRTTHLVHVEKIRQMLDQYERFVTVQSIMGSHLPEWKQALFDEASGTPTCSSDTPCPDLVGQPGFMKQSKKTHPHLFSSLPDVSSIGRSGQAAKFEDGIKKSTESLNFQDSGRPFDDADGSERDDLEFSDSSSEPDSNIDLMSSVGDQRMPDCVVESVITEEPFQADAPVAFSESIKQRVRPERLKGRSGFEKESNTEVINDANQSDRGTDVNDLSNEKETGDIGLKTTATEKESSKELHFYGDWPSDGPLDQRKVKKREMNKAACGNEMTCKSEDVSDDEKSVKPHSGPNVKEFQRLLDLIQPVTDQADASPEPPLTPNCGEELELSFVMDGTEESNPIMSHSKTVDLPDCVLDWKAVKELECESWEGAEKEESGLHDRTGLLSAEAWKDEGGSHANGSRCSLDGSLDINRENPTEDNDSLVSETSLSLGESTETTDCSQDRKQRRRSGKHCKLALTFTQNCSSSSSVSQDCLETTPQNLESSHNSSNSVIAPNIDSVTFVIPQETLETESTLEADVQSPTPPFWVETSRFTQTEPQDFAFLWRLNCKESLDYTLNTAYRHLSNVTVLSIDPSHFIPDVSSALPEVPPSGQSEVPYRVVHEKGTNVEEKDFGGTQDRLESLRILSRHFRLVSFDILEDLYEKCHQDLEWTTNLLLDSGERFFRDENDAVEEVDQSLLKLCEDFNEVMLCSEEDQKEGFPTRETTKEEIQWSTCEAVLDPEDPVFRTDALRAVGRVTEDHPETSYTELSPQREIMTQGLSSDCTDAQVTLELDNEAAAWGGNFEIEAIIKDPGVEIEDDVASMDEVNRLLQAELEEMERVEGKRKAARQSQNLDIQSVELKLPTELALQLTELFGPVGVDPGSYSHEDYVVQMDLTFAKLLYQKWKDSIQERQKQTNLSFHLLQESSLGQPGAQSQMPFMDHWNASHRHVSLREIIKEEQALHQNIERTRKSRADLDRRDGATLLKESQLYSLFPNIDKHFLRDILRDHNYNLTQTEMFLHSLLSEEPVKVVVAPEAPRAERHRGTSKERKKMQKQVEQAVVVYQDTEDPEYEDFRAEASLQRKRQLESFSKAAEAYKQGRREVASFYAQQGHMHGERMREADHRAAAQIFQRVNSSLLPKNVLDLHGLHVHEALQHLAKVLQDKSAECEQGLCQPQLSIITGRGNHSQGGVARIRPAVIDHLTKKHYRFSEPNPGLVLVSLK